MKVQVENAKDKTPRNTNPQGAEAHPRECQRME